MDERDPVSDSERVLRRLLPEWYNPKLIGALSPVAFRPASNDRDGLSVFRSFFATPLEVASTHREKTCFVAELLARDFRQMSLSVVPNPLDQGPRGHALVPELNIADYEHNRRAMKELTKRLADIAARTVVYRPDK